MEDRKRSKHMNVMKKNNIFSYIYHDEQEQLFIQNVVSYLRVLLVHII